MVLGLQLLGCGACLDPLPACDPLYEPTFDEVYTNTLEPSCALGGCHDADKQAGGLDLSAPDIAFAALVDDGRALASDAECSQVIERLVEGSMPPGAPLSDEEICAVQMWVAEGAKR